MLLLLKVRRGLGLLALWAIVLVLWLNFAPVQIGGRTTYVILTGNSMMPTFQRGDLVLVHADSEYNVGEAVAYHHPLIGPVFHRIIGQEGGNYLLRGDNNTWDDSYMPNHEEVIGKQWLKIPSLGKLIAKLREPGMLALFSAGAGTALVTTITEKRTTSSRQLRKSTARSSKKGRVTTQALPNDVLTTLALLTLAALALLLYVFLRPSFISVPTAIPYQHHAEFGYSAQVPADLYDQAEVGPGEPIFRRITDTFTVTFAYGLTADQPLEGPRGTLHLFAVLRESSGWKHTLELQPAIEFEGPAATASADIDINQLQTYMDRLEELTGLSPSEYTFSIRPEVAVVGVVGGRQLVDQYAPTLDFLINPLQVRLANNQATGEQMLQQIEERDLQTTVLRANTLPIFGAQLNIFTVRIAAVVIFVAFAALTLFAVLRIRNLARLPEVERIQSLYGASIIPITGIKFDSDMPMTEVSTIEHLLRLAEQEGRSVLCEQRADGTYYFLATETFVFYFLCPPSPFTT